MRGSCSNYRKLMTLFFVLALLCGLVFFALLVLIDSVSPWRKLAALIAGFGIVFCVLFWMDPPQEQGNDGPGFAIGLAFVMFAQIGWVGAALLFFLLRGRWEDVRLSRRG